jgi:serine/threonine-protein kinase HipA
MKLKVTISGVTAGFITTSDDGFSKFELSEDYLRLPSRPVLGQCFEDRPSDTFRGKGQRLPPFFENIVPEGKLRKVIEHTLDLPQGDDFALLQAVSQDLPGAVEIQTVSEDDVFELNSVTDQSKLAKHRKDESGLRFSLAGVQLKFSVLTSDKRVTLPGKDEHGEWIVKLDSPTFVSLAENEFATMEWARASGFNVPETRLIPLDELETRIQQYAPSGSQALLIKRYDRTPEGPVHQEDFNQVVNQPSSMKYDQIRYEDIAALAKVIVGPQGYDQIIRRLTFMIATGNYDAHLKNWSLIYPDQINAQLSPVYDQVAIVGFADDSFYTKWALKLAGVKEPHATDLRAFERLAEKTGEDPERVMKLVQQTLSDIKDAWHEAEIERFFPPGQADTIRAFWSSVPLLSNHTASLSG